MTMGMFDLVDRTIIRQFRPMSLLLSLLQNWLASVILLM